MKNKMIAFLIATFSIMTFCSCDSEKPNDSIDESSNSTSEVNVTSQKSEVDTQPAESTSVSEPDIELSQSGEDYWLTNIYYDDIQCNNGLILATIEKCGETDYNFFDYIVLDNNGEPIFRGNGLQSDGKYFKKEGNNGYALIDEKGDVLFGIDFSSDDEWRYVCDGNGYLVTFHENSNFESADNRCSIYGPNGELVKEFSFPTDGTLNCEYYGSSVFHFEYDCSGVKNEFCYNAEKDITFYDFGSEFINDKSLTSSGYYTPDGKFTKFDEEIHFVSSDEDISNTTDYRKNTILEYNIKLVYNEDDEYSILNLDNNKIYPLNNIKISSGQENLCVGKDYLAFTLLGADGELYTTIYDSSGNCVLNPQDSKKGYLCKSIADGKAFLVKKNVKNNEREIVVYDLKKGEFIECEQYSKLMLETEVYGNIAVASTYNNEDEHWFNTLVNKEGYPIFDYSKRFSYSELGKSEVKGEYSAYMNINTDSIKNVDVTYNDFIWNPSDNYIDLRTLFNDNINTNDEILIDESSSNSSSSSSSSITSMQGQINCHGGTVAGFTTSYVVDGGACSTVRNSLGNTWHVTAKNVYYNYGITWYELWDTDDGDYYGWVDANYIDFY